MIGYWITELLGDVVDSRIMFVNETKQNVYVLPALFWGGPRLL